MSLTNESVEETATIDQRVNGANADATLSRTPSFNLPDKPVVTIETRKSWVSLNLRDLWAYRELLYFLMWRDIKVRYKQTVLGAAWAVIQPLTTMIIFTYFFGKLARVQTDSVPYPVFCYT